MSRIIWSGLNPSCKSIDIVMNEFVGEVPIPTVPKEVHVNTEKLGIIAIFRLHGLVAIKWYCLSLLFTYIISALFVICTGASTGIIHFLITIPYLGVSISEKAEKYPSFILPLAIYGVNQLLEPIRVYMVLKKVGNGTTHDREVDYSGLGAGIGVNFNVDHLGINNRNL